MILEGFFRSLKGYLEEEGGKVPPGQSWLGTSDVIESLFGKYKSFLGEVSGGRSWCERVGPAFAHGRSNGGTGS